MILQNCNPDEFPAKINGKTLVCFGAGNASIALCEQFPELKLAENIAYFVDNATDKWYLQKKLSNQQIPVYPPEYLYKNADSNTTVLIANWDYCYQIYEQLNQIAALDTADCYIGPMIDRCYRDKMAYSVLPAPPGFRANKEMKIPKVIHYCWFGKKLIPEPNAKCIESWRKYCPDYEIIEWNESNYDVTKNQYMHQAYQAKKWGFVPDYARLDIIYSHGGIYLDTDVELVKNLDELLYNDAFCGMESIDHINFGLGFGSVKNHPIIRDALDHYSNLTFIRKDGSYNLTASPVIQTQIMKRYGLKQDGTFQILGDMTIYPAVYLCPKSPSTDIMFATEDTFSIHHFDGSWLPSETISSREQRKKLISIAFKRCRDE